MSRTSMGDRRWRDRHTRSMLLLFLYILALVSAESESSSLRRKLGKKSKSASVDHQERMVRGESSLPSASSSNKKKKKKKSGSKSTSSDEDVNGNDENIPFLVATDDDGADFDLLEADETVRVVVLCGKSKKFKKGKEDARKDLPQEKCLEKVLDVGLDPPVEVVSSLDSVHQLALRLHAWQLPILKDALPSLRIVIDPDRTPLEVVLDYEEDDDYDDFHRLHDTDHNLRIRRELASGRPFQDWPGQMLSFGTKMIGAPTVHQSFNETGAGATVCILDTGYSNHPDFVTSNIRGSSALVDPWSVDRTGHGTHCAGIIGAADNDFGVVGVAPKVKLLIVRVFQDNGRFYGSDVTRAIDECREGGADIINMSFGGTRYSEAEDSALHEARFADGLLLIAAAGNTGNKGNDPHYPAKYSSVLSVAAIDESRRHAPFSTFNEFVGISAPGTGILSTTFDPNTRANTYQYKRGTSMAAPFVSGVAALLKSRHPSSTADEIVKAMKNSADKPSSDSYDSFRFGAGVVDAVAAIKELDKIIANRVEKDEDISEEDGIDDADDTDDDDDDLQLTIKILLRFNGVSKIKYKLLENDPSPDRERLLNFGYGSILPDVLHKQVVPVDASKCYRLVITDDSGVGIQGEGNGLSIFYGGKKFKSYKNIKGGGKVLIGAC